MEKSLSKWYSKQWLVILLCVFFFPVGLYGLWKSESFSKGGKIAITIIIAFFIFAQISNQFDTADQSASTTNENIAELSRLSTSANRLIAEYKLDSAKLSIDSLKIIGADTAYVKAMEDAIVEKKSFIKNIEGSYVYSKAGINLKIVLSQKNKASLSSDLNGIPINGVNSKGTYSIVKSNEVKVMWEKDGFNKTMGDFEYDSSNKTLKISNGTIYKRKEANTKNTNRDVVKSSTIKSTKSKNQSKPKNYVMFCGEQYEAGTNFRNSLPNDYQQRAGFYCMKNYREAASSVYYSGFNNAGILVTAVGELTGKDHIILFMCDGSIY
jgi:hypothetical protein